MALRALRRRWTPSWLRLDARRRLRDAALRRLGLQRCHLPPLLIKRPELATRSLLRYVVGSELLVNPNLTFLQIGACDGIDDDDLGQLVDEHDLRGVLVEPQPTAFARLEEKYRSRPNLTLLQAAIADREGVRDLYCRREGITLAASFERKHLARHGIAESEIVAVPVRCHTVASALRTAGLDRVDLIQIDAEGYDWPIIRSIDLARLRPAMIRFEYRHMRERDADACLAHLARHGYEFLVESRDLIAVRRAASARDISSPQANLDSHTQRGYLATSRPSATKETISS